MATVSICLLVLRLAGPRCVSRRAAGGVAAGGRAGGHHGLGAVDNGFAGGGRTVLLSLMPLLILLFLFVTFLAVLILLIVLFDTFMIFVIRRRSYLWSAGAWRNGRASDSRSEGWEFESLCSHLDMLGEARAARSPPARTPGAPPNAARFTT